MSNTKPERPFPVTVDAFHEGLDKHDEAKRDVILRSGNPGADRVYDPDPRVRQESRYRLLCYLMGIEESAK